MNFENPAWLAMTPLILLLIGGVIVFGLSRRNVRLSQFAATRLLDRLTEKASMQRTLVKAGLIMLATALIGVSLARPQYGVDFVERKARGLDIVFVLDSSRSMLATDLRPTRLERAKLAIIDLVQKLESDRIGLVVFAGSAFLQTPPTLDYSAFNENLNSVGPSSISRGGSNIGQALREAAKAFPKDDNFKVVVLLTDGEDLEEQAIDTAREVAKDGIKVYSIGIGTPEGTYLKIRTENGAEEFVRDSDGQPVRSRLDETTLREISRLTRGSYSRLAGQSLETLYNSVLSTLPREERMSELQETRIERYQWLLFAAVLFLVLEILMRRRKPASVQLIIALALLNLATTPLAYADATIQESSSTDPRAVYNQAHVSLMKGDYAEAKNLYEQAIEYSDDIELERDGLYNLGHTMNQMGEEALQAQDFESAVEYWQQAEELFKSANELDSTDTASLEDAKQMTARRKALETFLEQQNSQEQQQSNNDQDQQQDSEAESDESQQGKNDSSSDESSTQSEDSQSSEGSSPEEQANKSSSNEEKSDEDSSAKEQSNTSENNSDNASSNSADDANSNPNQDQNAASKSPEGAKPEETESNQSAESTQDPTANMEQQEEETVPGTESEDTSESENNAPSLESAGSPSDSAEAQDTTAVIQGMKISEARQLLDSLRNDEQLLPFTDSSDETRNSERNSENRNW